MPGTEPEGSPVDDRASDATVRPLERGLAVLRAMSVPGCERARPGDLVRATGLARSTVDRVVATLGQLGHLRFDGREAVLAPRLMELGNAYLSASGLPDSLAGRAGRLADALDESVSLAVPDRDGVRFIAQATRRRTMSLAFRIGDALPAERCAPGALFASGWTPGQWEAWRARHEADPHDAGFPAVPPRPAPEPEAEFRHRAEQAGTRGWALDDQLIEPGLVAVAVPVHGPRGEVACALSAVSHLSRHDADGLARAVLPQLLRTAEEMEQALTESAAAPPTTAPPPRTDGSGKTKDELGAGFLQSLARGLAVLQALGDARGDGLPLAALARATGLPRATARRSLLALVQLGYAESTGRLFQPLPRVLELGHAHLSGLSFGDIVQPHLHELVGRVHEAASVGVLDGDEVRYVARLATLRVMSANFTPGSRLPAYATAMGRVLLAGLPAAERLASLRRARPVTLTRHTVSSVPELAALVEEVAEADCAVVVDELEEGLRSVAVPIRSADGGTFAALSVAHPSGTSSSTAPETEQLLAAVRETVAAIEADLRTVARHHPLPAP